MLLYDWKKFLVGYLTFYAQMSNSNASSTPYNSVCTHHGFFQNKKSDLLESNYYLTQMKLSAQRNRIDDSSRNMYVNSQKTVMQNTIFSSMSLDDKQTLIQYFSLIKYMLAEAKLIKNLKIGNCGESVSESVIDTLLKQLKEKKFESIQVITLWTKDKEKNHSFVIYNAPLLKSQAISNKKLIRLLKNLKSENDDPVILCDEFEHFHGQPRQWNSHFFGAEGHIYNQYDYAELEVHDLSMPILSPHLSARQVDAIKEELLKILDKHVSDEKYQTVVP
ncbi:Uncharacterised protein [Legionella beliardensis]|uniref:Uncharacterized protein n=1 Tax=Legionella beliardensis TaxID=91822 RepID=A0A378HYI4_9GAMM|nr:hypothetical protein [Legionella beliardensis]STX27958.1 Uncharacterised protein [Legionella beliardensis]